MNKDAFIETQNVSNFRKAINGLVNRDRLQPGIMVVEGKSGRGKSMAADNWFSIHGGVFFRVWESMSQHAFLQELAFEALGARPHGSHNCKRAIINKLRVSPQAIIVDEADRLSLGRLEDLRDINEASGAAIVMVGEDGLLGKLGAKERIYSRVAEVVKFEPVRKEDIVLYVSEFADLKISPDAAAKLAQKSDGSFRVVHNYTLRMAEFAEANQLDLIEAGHIDSMQLRDNQ